MKMLLFTGFADSKQLFLLQMVSDFTNPQLAAQVIALFGK